MRSELHYIWMCVNAWIVGHIHEDYSRKTWFFNKKAHKSLFNIIELVSMKEEKKWNTNKKHTRDKRFDGIIDGMAII